LSDISSQEDIVAPLLEDAIAATVSYVGQSPLDGSKIALWVQFQSEGVFIEDGGLSCCQHNGYRHYRTSVTDCLEGDSYQQTLHLFEDLQEMLQVRHSTLADNCLRTWLFVRDIDTNYKGVVEARKAFFSEHGLTPDTHFIASTGIEGRSCCSATKVLLDAHCVMGVRKEQIHYLYAKDYLNPTYEYGVTFERGVYIDYGDRRQVYISGTASIDNKGNILYSGDVLKQSRRACDNVEALLHEAECSFNDVAVLLIYLRDIADYAAISSFFENRFPDIPKQIVLAPVCRPGWLVEIECIALKSVLNKQFANF
jgi:enamine deaminase RidA (YjgF/YER057c/UK114 family)